MAARIGQDKHGWLLLATARLYGRPRWQSARRTQLRFDLVLNSVRWILNFSVVSEVMYCERVRAPVAILLNMLELMRPCCRVLRLQSATENDYVNECHGIDVVVHQNVVTGIEESIVSYLESNATENIFVKCAGEPLVNLGGYRC